MRSLITKCSNFLRVVKSRRPYNIRWRCNFDFQASENNIGTGMRVPNMGIYNKTEERVRLMENETAAECG